MARGTRAAAVTSGAAKILSTTVASSTNAQPNAKKGSRGKKRTLDIQEAATDSAETNTIAQKKVNKALSTQS